MAIKDQTITDTYALYHGDCLAVMPQLPDASIDYSIYSPPFQGLYQYSSDIRDLSNCLTADEFFTHYRFVVEEVTRLTKPGRITAVHCMDIPTGNTGLDHAIDFPGDVIRLHESIGWEFMYRHFIWKEPLTVRNRTMTKALSHRGITEDSTRASIAHADQLCVFRRKGKNAVPVSHPQGFLAYIGERSIPHELMQYRGWTGDQKENRFSHWIWRQYASSFWDDVRMDRVLPYRAAREENDERHVHPLQLDVIERGITMHTNPGDTVLTPFMGVGSEVYGAVQNRRKAIGIELKASYYHQAVKNVESAFAHRVDEYGQEVMQMAEAF